MCMVFNPYFSARFFLETYKVNLVSHIQEPLLSTGQMLSIPFILTGIIILYRSHTASKNSDA